MAKANLGPYELLKRLAAGGMGEVYLARASGVEGFAKTVVVKRIFPHFRDDPEYRRLFVREAKILSTLHHPNIVQVYDLSEAQGELFIAMEYVAGIDLRALDRAVGKKGARLSSPVIATIAYDMLEALDYAHSRSDEKSQPLGIVHHDISPQNVLLALDGYAKLCDFGVARFVRAGEHTNFARMRGKWGYAAPEQVAGERVDGRADLFSVGAVLFELVTGKPLFDARNLGARLEQQSKPLPDPASLAPGQDPVLCKAIMTSLAMKADARFHDASQFREAIEPVLLARGPVEARRDLVHLVTESAPPPLVEREGVSESRTEISKHWSALVERASQSPGPALPPQPTVILKTPRRDTAPDSGWHSELPAPTVSATTPLDSGTRMGESVAARSSTAVIPAKRRTERPLVDWRAMVGDRRTPMFYGIVVAGLLLAGNLVVMGRLLLRGSDHAQLAPPSAPTPVAAVPMMEAPPSVPPSPTFFSPTTTVVGSLPRVSELAPTPVPAPAVPSASPEAAVPVPEEAEGTKQKTNSGALPRPNRTPRPAPVRKSETGYLSLNAVPWAHVRVDGERLAKTTPIRELKLNAGQHVVELEGPSGEKRQLEVMIEAGETTTRVVRFTAAGAAPSP